MSVVSQRPRRQYEVLHWGHVDLQEYANGRFVSNNNIFTIVFFNTYYHKQINKILISACNETFRQSSDPVYAHTPMRNVGGLRTFNPKLKDSAGGEVKNLGIILGPKLTSHACALWVCSPPAAIAVTPAISQTSICKALGIDSLLQAQMNKHRHKTW